MANGLGYLRTNAIVAAKALARTAIEFLASRELRATVTAEWMRREP